MNESLQSFILNRTDDSDPIEEIEQTHNRTTKKL
jgi:hypothetical protein